MVTTVGKAQVVDGADQHLRNAEGHLRERYGVPMKDSTSSAASLLRPNQHVCARWLTLGAQSLRGRRGQGTAVLQDL